MKGKYGAAIEMTGECDSEKGSFIVGASKSLVLDLEMNINIANV
jgi:hypothetical protein